MADQWEVVSTERTPWVQGATETVDAMAISFVTKPSRVFLQRMIPYSSWLTLNGPQGLGFWLDPVAAAVEGAIADGSADGAGLVQDVDPVTSLLADFVEFIVGYTPPGGMGRLTDTVRWPIDAITITLTGEIIGLQDALDAARARLVAVAGG